MPSMTGEVRSTLGIFNIKFINSGTKRGSSNCQEESWSHKGPGQNGLGIL